VAEPAPQVRRERDLRDRQRRSEMHRGDAGRGVQADAIFYSVGRDLQLWPSAIDTSANPGRMRRTPIGPPTRYRIIVVAFPG